MGERDPKQYGWKKYLLVFLFKSEHLDFSKAFPHRDTFKPPRCCAVAMAYPSVIWMFWMEPLLFLWWIVERALQVFCFFIYLFLAHIFCTRSHVGEHIYYCMDIHYRAVGKHCRETKLSCCLFLKMKTLLGCCCCCLGNLVTLTLLSTLFATRFIKCIAAGN